MASERQRSTADLRRLARDIGADLETLDRLEGEATAVARRPTALSDEATAYLAVKVHAWYTALETILDRIARVIEGGVPTGPASHQELLRGSTLPFDELRPPVIAAERLGDLADLLAFRHFFRHAYAVALDDERMRDHAGTLARVHEGVRSDLERFIATVRGWVQELEA